MVVSASSKNLAGLNNKLSNLVHSSHGGRKLNQYKEGSKANPCFAKEGVHQLTVNGCRDKMQGADMSWFARE